MAPRDDRGRSGDEGSAQRRGSGGQGRGGQGRGGAGKGRDGRPRRDDGPAQTQRGGGTPIGGPGGSREPVGLDRARTTPGAPPRRTPPKAAEQRVPPPQLPEGFEGDVSRAVRKELSRAIPRKEVAEQAQQAMAFATVCLEEREGEAALPALRWLKQVAPRTPIVREALGAALYLTERYGDALTELQTYRRFTDAEDQNHLIADCLRALGRNTDRIPALVEAMQVDEVPLDRRIEGLIVWASWLADQGDVGAARAVLRPALEQHDPGDTPDEHHLRLWYVAADLAERADDEPGARRWFRRIVDVAEGFFDAEDRLDALE